MRRLEIFYYFYDGYYLIKYMIQEKWRELFVAETQRNDKYLLFFGFFFS